MYPLAVLLSRIPLRLGDLLRHSTPILISIKLKGRAIR
jgi:hypothetical protein